MPRRLVHRGDEAGGPLRSTEIGDYALPDSNGRGQERSDAPAGAVMLILQKGKDGDMGESVKQPVMEALFTLYEQLGLARVFRLQWCTVAVMPDHRGDVEGFLGRVFTIYEPTGVRMDQVSHAVTRIQQAMAQAGFPADDLGWGLLEERAKRMYMHFDMVRS